MPLQTRGSSSHQGAKLDFGPPGLRQIAWQLGEQMALGLNQDLSPVLALRR